MVKACPLKEDNSRNIPSATYHRPNEYCGEKSTQRHICQLKARHIKEREELRTLYKKLREVVPSCKPKPASSVDIVLQAVDYINELHKQLEEEFPGVPRPVPPFTTSSQPQSAPKITFNNTNRFPIPNATNEITPTRVQLTRLRD